MLVKLPPEHGTISKTNKNENETTHSQTHRGKKLRCGKIFPIIRGPTDQGTIVECDQTRLIFQHSSSCGPCTSSIKTQSAGAVEYVDCISAVE